MKRMTIGALSLLAVSLLAFAVLAQPPGGRQGMQRGRGGGQGRGGTQGQQSGQQPSMHMLIMVLNADGDEEISATEIRKAAASLRKLDRNRDGKLTVDELMPSGPPPFGGPGQGGMAGQGRGEGAEGRGPQRGGLEQGGRPGGPGFGGPGQDGPGGPGGPGGGLIEQLMGFDADEDGKVTKKELSEGMESAFEKGDLDKDGAIDREEAEKLLEELGPPHGDHGGRGGEARGDRPVGEERSQRPQ